MIQNCEAIRRLNFILGFIFQNNYNILDYYNTTYDEYMINTIIHQLGI